MNTHTRRAFTLFDLLVVLAIIGLLIGLLLPMIQLIRLQAARAQSSNNLKQLGLAAHSHHDVYKRFPSGNDKLNISAHAYLLPFIEQNALYQQLAPQGKFDDKVHEQAGKYVIPVFVSPLDAGAPVGKGTTNYLFCAGAGYALADNNGAFFQDSKVSLLRIRDGSSNTLMVGETMLGAAVKGNPDVLRQYVKLDRDSLKNLKDEAGVGEFKEGVKLADDRGHSWSDGRHLRGTFTGTRRVNDAKPDVSCDGLGGLSGLRGLRGTTQVGLCDGSVRTVNERISLRTWQLVANGNDGEAIPDDWN